MSPTDIKTGVPVSDLDPYSDASLREPLPGWEALRDAGPVVWLHSQEVFALARYREVREALSDWQHFSSASGTALNEAMNSRQSRRTVLNMDPPEHTGVRKMLIQPLTTRSLKQVSVAIEDEAERLADDLVKRGHFDGVDDLARHIPLMIVSRLVGLPESGRARMLQWAADSFNGMGPMNDRALRGLAGLGNLAEFLADEVLPDKVIPGSWAAHVFERAAAENIPLEQAQTLLLSYVLPSLDTTIQAIASAIWLFACHHEQWELLRQHPELINRAINEVLRLESPVTIFSRVLTVDHELAGAVLPKDARILVMFASGNRDERKWPEPKRFDIRRDQVSEHLAFGFGQHLCMGQGLARLELRAQLGALAKRVRGFELGESEQILNNTLRGFSRMEISVN